MTAEKTSIFRRMLHNRERWDQTRLIPSVLRNSMKGIALCHPFIHLCSYARLYSVPGRFEPPVTVIMLSLGVTGALRHLGFASESSLPYSRFLLDPNILSG